MLYSRFCNATQSFPCVGKKVKVTIRFIKRGSWVEEGPDSDRLGEKRSRVQLLIDSHFSFRGVGSASDRR